MDRQAAYDLFTAFLQKRQVKGIELSKELPDLLKFAYSQGFFINPHTVHELSEWRRFGDKLWELTLDDDKAAKKMSKLWRVVHNELLLCQAEKRAAREVVTAQEKNQKYDPQWGTDTPNPPVFTTVHLPAAAPVSPSAPPVAEEPVRERSNKGGPPYSPENSVPIPQSASSPSSQEPIPGAESDLAGAMARERREVWAALARQGAEQGDQDILEAASGCLAFPVTFAPNPAGGLQATVTVLDWKMLAQLRSTVGQYGVTSEPTKQMLEYLFNAHVLLPSDIKGIARLIFTQHQHLLFNAHWQAEAQASVAIQRGQGDPLQGLTLDELLGLGPFQQMEAQALMGPDKCREAMRVAKRAIEKVKAPGGIPIYMGIKQGREEALGPFVDKIAEAIDKAGVQDFMKGALLKQCVLQNCNSPTRSIITTMAGDWTIADLLEKAATVPSGSQAFLVEAIKQLGLGLQEQAKTSQTQVLAALAPLQAATASTGPRPSPPGGRMKCFRCGNSGHIRRECQAAGVWCAKCRSDSHNTTACRRRSGNFRSSANSGRAGTQIAAAMPPAPSTASANNYNQPPAGASAWTWQPQ
ncbi:GAK8 protein, partial [Pelecanoides urinatrix]|nr:GAK8 protein [Pelecanoides urinatrix]